ncbi:MAG: hypothetical protein II776_05395, partial [Clostridia bacterium]|nr:hypothetical protein [Clostridia bacterium]
MALTFFLGANSAEGFFSLFPALADEPGRRIFALKGGPGSGKSTCIRRVAREAGGPEEWIRCSSDPDSLDGAILPGAAVLDGTAPHLFDPAFPGAGGDYLPMPPFLGLRELGRKREALLALQAASRAEYASARRLLSAVRALREERRALLFSLLPQGFLEKKLALLRKKERLSRPGEARGALRLRFLDGFTPKGPVFFGETVAACARRAIVLKDSAGLGQELLAALKDSALECGETVYACMDPLEPGRVLHLLLPGRELALLSHDGRRALPDLPGKTVRIEPALPPEIRGRARLLRKTEDALVEEVTARLSSAHAFHDKIEALYRPHLDTKA